MGRGPVGRRSDVSLYILSCFALILRRTWFPSVHSPYSFVSPLRFSVAPQGAGTDLVLRERSAARTHASGCLASDAAQIARLRHRHCGARPRTVRRAELDIFGRLLARAQAQEHAADDLEYDFESTSAEPVVKVYCVNSYQDPTSPWANKPQQQSGGSGFTIQLDGRLLVLTNAHVVADATFVEVRKAGDARKYVAKRLKLSHECDLALLNVEDESFWEGVQPLMFGSMPYLQDEVAVVGYPEGGEGVSITQGVVSRIEIQQYVHSGSFLLAIQIDAAINPGNSGGPALDRNGDVIGVAFQNQQNSQNIGFLIPVPTIQHFLQDAQSHDPTRCAGFCSLGIFVQELENSQLRCYLGLNSSHSGVLIRGTVPLAPAADVLRHGDIMMAIDGWKIANDGTFAVGRQERLSFQHLIHLKFPGDAVELHLLRDRKDVKLNVTVQPLLPLVPRTIYDRPQPYFLYAGLVFLPLSCTYLEDWGEEWRSDAPHQLVELALAGFATEQHEEPVILSRCFPSERTAGYGSLIDRRVLSVCGTPVRNLQHMYELILRLHDEKEFIELELQGVGSSVVAAIDTSIAEEVNEEIMRTYRVPAVCSPDLLHIKPSVV